MSARLPETDLANLAFQAPGKKRLFLARWGMPKGDLGSYEPLRKSLGEAASVELPLLPELGTTSLSQLESLVLKECKGNNRLELMNLEPVRALRAFMTDKNADAEFLEDLPITLYPGMRYSFWAPMLVRYQSKARVVFMDLRRTGNLTGDGLHFCLSLMHERFRVLNPDFASVACEVWRFSKSPSRTINVVGEWAQPISFKAIMNDVAETYEILNYLQSQQPPSTGTDDGPLFG